MLVRYSRTFRSLLLCVLCVLCFGATIIAVEDKPGTITIGIKDNGFERSDPKHPAWKEIKHADAYQGSYYHDNRYDSPDLYGTWTPFITTPGRYNVYMHYIAHPNRSEAAQLEIKHANGTFQTTLDQRENGKTWYLLGQFEFATGDAGYVRLHSAPGYTVYEGVRFELASDQVAPAATVASPNPAAEGGQANVETESPKYVEVQKLGNTSPPTWIIPSDLEAGEYELLIRYPATDKPITASVHVKFDLGLDTTKTLSPNKGEWVNIGRYSFAPGYSQYVKLTSSNGDVTSVETIRLVQTKKYKGIVTIPFSAVYAKLSSEPRYKGAIPVAVKKDEQGRYSLTRGGEPYFIKGVCGSENLASIAASGGNALRTYSHMALNGYDVLDAAYEKGIGVFIGLWMIQQDAGIDYSNPFYRDKIAAQLEEFKSVVLQYKDHPAVIGWALGNEQDKGNADVWYHVNELAQFIHEVDPNHPTMAVLAGAHPLRVGYIRTKAPNIDIVGVNSYIHVGDVYNNVVNLGGWQGPYMLTEWGPDAAYEVAKVNGVAPIEQASHDKASLYFQRYQSYVAAPAVSDHLVGSFVFKLADVFGTTHTWYNILLEDGKKTPQLDEMTKAWTGQYPSNQAPRVHSLALTSTSYQGLVLDPKVDATVVLAKGERFHLLAAASDDENDPLKFRWEVRYEYKSKVTSTPPQVIENVVMEQDTGNLAGMYFTAPNTPGDYRVYLYVYDNNHNVGTHNYPFRVE